MIFRSRSSVAFSGDGVGTPVVDCPEAPGPDFTGAIDGLLTSARIGDLRSSAEVPALEASTVADARIAVIIVRMVCSHTGLILAPPIILLKPYSVTCELNHSQVSNHASARRSASCLLVPQVGAVVLRRRLRRACCRRSSKRRGSDFRLRRRWSNRTYSIDASTKYLVLIRRPGCGGSAGV